MLALFRLHRVHRFAVYSRISLLLILSYSCMLLVALSSPPCSHTSLISRFPLPPPRPPRVLSSSDTHTHTHTHTHKRTHTRTHVYVHTRRSLLFAAQLHLRLRNVRRISHRGHHDPRRRWGKVQARAPEEARLLLHVDRPRRVPKRYRVSSTLLPLSSTLVEAEEGERPTGWS